MFPDNKNKKIAQGMGSTRSVRRASKTSNPIWKSPTGCRAFLLSMFSL